MSPWSGPRCSISRDPCREEYTICTAIAPDAAFTFRTYGDTASLYGPGLMRNLADREQRTSRSGCEAISPAGGMINSKASETERCSGADRSVISGTGTSLLL